MNVYMYLRTYIYICVCMYNYVTDQLKQMHCIMDLSLVGLEAIDFDLPWRGGYHERCTAK